MIQAAKVKRDSNQQLISKIKGRLSMHQVVLLQIVAVVQIDKIFRMMMEMNIRSYLGSNLLLGPTRTSILITTKSKPYF